MARKKKDVYHVGPLTEGKKNIIAALMDEYEIETADDMHEKIWLSPTTIMRWDQKILHFSVRRFQAAISR